MKTIKENGMTFDLIEERGNKRGEHQLQTITLLFAAKDGNVLLIKEVRAYYFSEWDECEVKENTMIMGKYKLNKLLDFLGGENECSAKDVTDH